jgi:hypothetical protein
MDASDGYEDLDLVLGEPGLVADTRDTDALTEADRPDPVLTGAIDRFDTRRNAARPAVCCLLRVNVAAGDPVSDRILSRLEKAVQAPDFCIRTGAAEYALALDGCDTATARRRLNLMIRLIQLDPAFQAVMPSIWAGVAPVSDEGAAQGLRTARLACDLASFQDSGHVEVVEL